MIADFTKVKEAIDEAVADGSISFEDAWKIAARIAQAGGNAIDQLSDPTQFEPLVEECEAAFDEYIAPLDIAYIPNALERRFVDPFLRDAIRRILTLMAESLPK